MRKLIQIWTCLGFLALPAFGARTTIADVLHRANGGTCSGYLGLSWRTFTSVTNQLIQGGSFQSRVSDGVVNVSLEPGTYTVQYQIGPVACTPTSETWVVPISGSPLPISAVRNLNPPAPGVSIALSSLAAGGATVGQCLLFGGTLWGPGACGSGGGGTVTSVAISRTNDTNVTATITGSPITTAGTINLSLGWIGLLSVARGGTGVTTLTGIAKGNGVSPLSSAVASDVIGLFTACSGSQYLGADGSCHNTSGSGTVTSVAQSFTGGLISVAGSPVTNSGTLALTVAGTSGGIPYFSGASTWASSAALTANLPVIGGGAGTAPTVGSRTGNTTQFATWTGATTSARCVHTDASGNMTIAAADCGSGGGASSVTTLTTCAVTVTSSTVLTVEGSAGDPCNVRVGNVVTSLTSAATLTISAGTGTVRIGFDTSVSPPTLKVYQGGLTFVCSGMTCNSVSGSAFGADDIEIATATSTTGTWDSNGVTDLRALPGKDRVIAGTYLASSVTAGSQTLSLDNVSFGFQLIPGLGANLTSGTTITPTNRVHHVTGTTTINTIAVTNVSDGEQLNLIMDGVAAFGTSGNIKAARTPVANTLAICVYTITDTKWYCIP